MIGPLAGRAVDDSLKANDRPSAGAPPEEL
jgi:hypothetical protein